MASRLDLKGANVCKKTHTCKSCTSRQELSREYLLANIGVDTAENEPLEVWGQFKNIQYYSIVSLMITAREP